jgi:hypothetical protein
MPYERHNELEPLALQDPLWRYMDFAKFVAMLATKKLYLTSVDKLGELGDKFEGLFPIVPKFTGFFADKDRQRYYAEKNKDARKFYYVNCWHGNDNESDAMWKIYVKGNQGIAIRTTVRQLKSSLEESLEQIWIAKVKYLDKWKSVPSNPTLHACLRKRKSFEHEKEVRMIWFDKDAKRSRRGKEVQCDLAKLIEKVYLAPTNSRWFKPVVESVLLAYGIEAEVVQSDLDSEPA